MKELGDFYGFYITKNRPRVIVLESRRMIDSLKKKKTDSWIVAWAEGNLTIFILDQSKMATESCHKKYGNKQYKALLKHELSHVFSRIMAGFGISVPAWLNEGLAIYSSGQNKFKKPVEKFGGFLKFYSKANRDTYNEAGFAVELLVANFGKKKLFSLLKNLRNVKNKTGFNKLFKTIYGFSPSYTKFNKLLKT
ncbi:MAG: hypothetical protein WC519_01995 [Parcubacteria group bacterium]